MSLNNNVWEIAEAYLAGTMPAEEITALNNRLTTDAAFANEFYEASGVIRSMQGSGRQKRFRSMLRDIHAQQAPGKKAKRILFVPQHIWRTAAVAASVAILVSAATFWVLSPSHDKTATQYNTISREVEHIKKVQAQQQATQNQLIQNINNNNNKPAPPPSEVRYTGTGFALTNDGYFVTAYHVINDGKGDYDSLYILNHDGQYFKATLVAFNADKDVAILKVEKKNFRIGKGDVPYIFETNKASLGAGIFTLGYPQDDIVYSEGYVSSRNGFEDDNSQYTLVLPAGHGQSGSPVVDDNGNILGLLTAIGRQDQSNTYAVSAKAITDLLHDAMPNDKALHLSHQNKLGGLSREQRIEKMEAYTVSVKVYKK